MWEQFLLVEQLRNPMVVAGWPCSLRVGQQSGPPGTLPRIQVKERVIRVDRGQAGPFEKEAKGILYLTTISNISMTFLIC